MLLNLPCVYTLPYSIAFIPFLWYKTAGFSFKLLFLEKGVAMNKKDTVVERLINEAIKSYVEKGFSKVNLVQLCKSADVSESTMRRYFPGGASSIYRTALEISANHVGDSFMEAIRDKDKFMSFRECALSYIQTVLNFWYEGGKSRSYVLMLYGPYGRPASFQFMQGNIIQDLTFFRDVFSLKQKLEDLSVHEDEYFVPNFISILTGSLVQLFIYDARIPSGRSKNFLEMLDVMITSFDKKISKSELSQQGINSELLCKIKNDADNLSSAINQVLKI